MSDNLLARLHSQEATEDESLRHPKPYRAALIRACRALTSPIFTPDEDDAEWARQVLDVLEPKV